MPERAGGLTVFSAEDVRARLTYEAAIPVVREAMIALSDGRVRQLLRSFIGVGEGRTFAIMPASLGERAAFGAKLVSVFTEDGKKAHEGVVVLFDGQAGRPVCIADAGEVTAIRTAASSAVATDAMARKDASVLAVCGTGRQAWGHVLAIAQVRRLKAVHVWSRDPGMSVDFARRVTDATGIAARGFPEAETAVAEADIVCTVTAAADPILLGAWIGPGTHVNVVGSSGPGQAEVDAELMAKSRFIVDHREHVLAHGGEFLRAKAAGIVGDDCIVCEIGEVLAGAAAGRTSDAEITVYKSLGHAVQDLAATAWLHGTL
ncbi:ornithine cyclodeaminase family protein [Phenylobacterium sp.]|uniref:ornithine cyclodeaminase family protein n=1 Tax=Phenylobacterium sp. TaxID=1871053 RepID=UPI0025F9E0C6|nr:ornithine cyclodeaminase family protein [Phenylobacterium sp.]MBX3484881.1 ornithine cyclodeaminase family protein [Phenylobacterium sp.]MCW5759956.1 ornithine cyclodeaminase family protein [Phenylobacterium sp.]